MNHVSVRIFGRFVLSFFVRVRGVARLALKGAEITNLRLPIENVRRTAEYASDMVQIVHNLELVLV